DMARHGKDELCRRRNVPGAGGQMLSVIGSPLHPAQHHGSPGRHEPAPGGGRGKRGAPGVIAIAISAASTTDDVQTAVIGVVMMLDCSARLGPLARRWPVSPHRRTTPALL